MPLATLALLAVKKTTLRWFMHLGGPSLLLLGLLDNSAIPLPGSMDLVTILLAAHRREPWVYYAIMATLGALVGGYVTYDMARKTGKEALAKRFPKKKMDWVYRTFEKWGFTAVAVPAMLPPPFPIVPMLIAAGALQYPTRKFLSALAVGRAVRYTVLAYLGAHYGTHIVRFLNKYYEPSLIVLIGFFGLAFLYGLFEYLRRRKSNRTQRPKPEFAS